MGARIRAALRDWVHRNTSKCRLTRRVGRMLRGTSFWSSFRASRSFLTSFLRRVPWHKSSYQMIASHSRTGCVWSASPRFSPAFMLSRRRSFRPWRTRCCSVSARRSAENIRLTFLVRLRLGRGPLLRRLPKAKAWQPRGSKTSAPFQELKKQLKSLLKLQKKPLLAQKVTKIQGSTGWSVRTWGRTRPLSTSYDRHTI